MSKIICDICGTSYPETAKQCPICGCVRPGDAQNVATDDQNGGNGSAGYTQVKGGHFTKGNVKKRTKDAGGKPAAKNNDGARGNGQNKDNRGLVIVAIILLLAVIGVVIYISVRFFGYEMNPTESVQQNISCTAIVLQQDTLEFTEPGTHHFNVSVKPAGCTDEIKIDSLDKSIVTVDGRLITIVGEGTTDLVVTCGNMTARCKVVVTYPEGSENTENTEASNPSISDGDTTEEFRLLQLTLKLTYKDQKHELYAGTVAKDQIVWGSENTAVAKFENGVVTAVGNGETKVYATYNGKTVYCVVNCNFVENNTGIGGNGGVGEDGGGATYQTGTIINCQENVNVRKGPGTSYELAGTVNLNEKITIYEKKSDGSYDWARIGDDRWVRMDFVKVD